MSYGTQRPYRCFVIQLVLDFILIFIFLVVECITPSCGITPSLLASGVCLCCYDGLSPSQSYLIKGLEQIGHTSFRRVYLCQDCFSLACLKVIESLAMEA